MKNRTILKNRLARSKNVIFLASLFVVSALATTGCMDVTSSNISPVVAPSASFAGITSAKNLDGTRIQLFWPVASSLYAHVLISQVQPDGSLQPVTTAPIGQTTYIASGLTPSTQYSFVVQAITSAGFPDGNTVQASAFTYAGVTQPASTILPTSTTLTFPIPGSSASGANVYCKTTTGVDTLVGTVTALSSSFPLTNLLTGTTYTCHVQAVSSATGLEDTNTAFASFQTTSQALAGAYKGVILVQAFGPTGQNLMNQTRSARTALFPFPTTAQVSITWKNYAISNPSGAVYRLVRTIKGGSFNMNTSVACTPTTTTSCQVCLNGSTTWNGTTISESSTSRTCQDLLVGTSPTQYDYAFSLIVNSSIPPLAEELPAAPVGDTGYRITVPIPPANMVLVHRDSVNYEMCSLYLNQTPIATSHQSCNYSGLGAHPTSSNAAGIALSNTMVAGTYDFGYNLFIDRWQEGCNWTPSACSGGSGILDSTGDCFGSLGYSGGSYTYMYTTAYPQTEEEFFQLISSPAAHGITAGAGSVFYATDTQTCWYNDGVLGWISNDEWTKTSTSPPFTANVQPANALIYQNIGTNQADPVYQKPPLLGTGAFANKVCSAQNVPGYGPKRMLRKREFVAAAGFQTLNGEPQQQAAAIVNNIIAQGNVGIPGTNENPANDQQCDQYDVNNSNAMWGSWQYADGNIPFGTFNGSIYNTLTVYLNNQSKYVQAGATNEQAGNSLLGFNIGSVSTQNCTSRFGAQDLIGNGATWLSDQFVCNPSLHTCTGQTSTFDAGNTDLNGFQFNGTQGPGGSSIGSVTFETMATSTSPLAFDDLLSWPASSSIASIGNMGASYISAPMGLPLVGSDGGNAIPYSTMAGIPNNQISAVTPGLSHYSAPYSNGAVAIIQTDDAYSGVIRQMATPPTLNVWGGPLGYASRFSFDISAAQNTDGLGNIIEGWSNWGENAPNVYYKPDGVVRCALPAE
jgi:hypothetical protein